MPVLYRCPNPECGVALKTPLRVPSGRSVACPKCHTRFVAEPTTGANFGTPGERRALAADAPPDTRAQDSADRARLAPNPIQALEPVRLNFESGDPVPGLSSWVLERQLGLGGFGEVWLARHEWKPEHRAVKFFTHPDARYRLVTHEKKVLVRVMKYAGGHPNIVPLVECNLESETPWLMYDYVPGGTLADVVREWRARTPAKRLSKAAKALFAISGALAHCHQLATPIVHRDLKPANVLRDAEGILRVIDFGIGGTAVAHPDASVTRELKTNSGRVPTLLRSAGSFGYASPQQKSGEAPTPRDDVYALGVLAFQLFMGDLTIWPGPDMADDLRALGLPSAVATLLRSSVSHNASRRPADAHEWKLMLEAQTTRSGGSDTKPHLGAPTPPPGTLYTPDDTGPASGPSERRV
jgi:eukaryotic-like serine/threonine-protein kinase